MPRYRRGRRNDEFITATEIACWTYCPEQWRLQYGLERLPANQPALDAGMLHHARKTVAERIAGSLILLGQALMMAAVLTLLAWVLLR